YVTPDSSEGMLLGQHVFIEPNYGQTTAGSGLWLDASYICANRSDGAHFVWGADKEDKIARLYIEIGAFDGALNRYEILGGLAKTDRIAFPNADIREGAPVTEIQIQTPPEGGEGPEMTDGAADAEDLPADDGIAEMVPGFEELPAFGEGEIPPDGFVDDEDASPIVSVGDGEPGDDVELPEDIFGDLGGGS
ncbi:MAG: hypothetical protein IKM59_04095, partial [Oscillospiraceae bacterium]|nr:hypothetical protein [Oscillospiraceae bacterium]